MSVESTAKKYLDNFLKVRTALENGPVNGVEEKVSTADFHITENVIVVRNSEPRYYAGMTRGGRTVWAHDMKLARPISGDLVHLYEEKLGEELIPLWPYAR
jgi:hypothetical protein